MPKNGWIDKSLDRSEEFYRAFNRTMDLNQLSTPLRSAAPGWIFLGQEITTIPDVAHPWDEKVVKAIQEIDPDIVPIWVKYIYREPYDWGTSRIHVIGRHGLAVVDKTPGLSTNPFPCTTPRDKRGCYIEIPNKIEHIFKGGEDPRASDLPGKYVPFNWEIYYFVKENYRKFTFKELKKFFITDPAERYKANQEKAEQEEAYKQADLKKYWQKKISNASDVETKEYFLGIGRRKSEPKKLYSK